MKTLTFLLSIFAAMLVTTTLLANNPDSTRVEKKIVKTIMITDDGKVLVDSTFITENGKVTVHVDTIMTQRHRGDREFKHMKVNRSMYSDNDEGEEFEVNVEMDGDSTHTMIIKDPNCKHKMMKFDEGNMPECKKMMILHNTDEMACPPPPPLPPYPGEFKKHQGMIDLNDPSIISYEKKLQKDGTEKITIIRKVE
jgi:hypothetical protein